jgi:hypothetical protein
LLRIGEKAGPQDRALDMLKGLANEPALASAFPVSSLLERSGNPVCGAAGLGSEYKITKIPYREDSLQPACWSVAEIPFTGLQGTLQFQIRWSRKRSEFYHEGHENHEEIKKYVINSTS